MPNELKPCPFCGSKATLHERSDGFYVDCATQLGFCGVMPSTWVCKTISYDLSGQGFVK